MRNSPYLLLYTEVGGKEQNGKIHGGQIVYGVYGSKPGSTFSAMHQCREVNVDIDGPCLRIKSFNRVGGVSHPDRADVAKELSELEHLCSGETIGYLDPENAFLLPSKMVGEFSKEINAGSNGNPYKPHDLYAHND